MPVSELNDIQIAKDENLDLNSYFYEEKGEFLKKLSLRVTGTINLPSLDILKQMPFVLLGVYFPVETFKEFLGLAAAYGLKQIESKKFDPSRVNIIVNFDNPGIDGKPFVEFPTPFTFDFKSVYTFLKTLAEKDQAAKPKNFVLKESELYGVIITQIGKPTGLYANSKPLSSKKLEELLRYHYNSYLTDNFSKDTTFVVFNPAQYNTLKFKSLAKLGIRMFTYYHLYDIIYHGKDYVNVDTSTWLKPPTKPSSDSERNPIPPGLPKPLVKGEYLGTKPYYFKNITPVLEYGSPTPSEKYYSSVGFGDFNNSLQEVGGHSLSSLDDILRQYLEDLILQIQVKGENFSKLYRGVSNDKSIDKYFKMKVGDTFIKEGFMSTSLSEGIAKNFSLWANPGNESVLFYFEANPSVKGLRITPQVEYEVLLPPRSGFTITNIEDYEDDFDTFRKRKIYATLFVDPIFKSLNTSGKSIKSIS